MQWTEDLLRDAEGGHEPPSAAHPEDGSRRRPSRTGVCSAYPPGFTDAKYFTSTGARWYGFSPVKIERASGIRSAEMFHGHNERVPIAGLHWGTEVPYSVVCQFFV